MILVIVTAKDLDDTGQIDAAVEHFALGDDITQIYCGNDNEGDKTVQNWAGFVGFPCIPHPINWNDIHVEGAMVKTNSWDKKYNANAPIMRDQDMYSGADAVLMIEPAYAHRIKKTADENGCDIYEYELPVDADNVYVF